MKTLILTLAILTGCLNTLQSYSQTAALRANELFATIGSEDGEMILRWFTTKEENSSSFIIERSHNGINYEVLGTKNAAGSSLHTRNYEINDITGKAVKAFYRIVLVAMDGGRTVSNIVVFNPSNIKMNEPDADTLKIEAVLSK